MCCIRVSFILFYDFCDCFHWIGLCRLLKRESDGESTFQNHVISWFGMVFLGSVCVRWRQFSTLLGCRLFGWQLYVELVVMDGKT